MSQAVKEPFVPHEETIKRDEEILDILNVIEKQTSAPRSLGSINTIKSALSNIKSKEESDDLKKHLEIVSELTELIKPHNAGGTLVINVRAEGSEGKEIAEKFDKALKMRLMQELLYVSSAVLKPLGEAADKSFAASLAMLSKMPKDSPDLAIAERIKPLIEFLKTASDPSEIDASIIFSYKSSLPMVLELTDAIKELSLVEEKTAIINNLQPLIADKVAQLNILENAFIGLNPALNTYLKDILVPSSLGYKVSSEANKNPLGQVEEEIKKAVKTISFALPNDSELAVYSDYLSLVGNNVFTLDLLKLSLSAKATQLIAKDFVKWADLIINDDIAKNSVQRPVVLLTGVSALDYDTNLDETSRKKAQAANFTLLAELVKEVTLLAPLELKDQSLFANSVAAKKSQIIIDPLNLELAEKIITKTNSE
jgi:hypothetical protein